MQKVQFLRTKLTSSLYNANQGRQYTPNRMTRGHAMASENVIFIELLTFYNKFRFTKQL